MSSPLTVAEGVMEEMVVKEDMAVMAVVVAMVVVAVTAATAAMAVTAVKETVPTGSLRDGLGRVETVPEVETVAMVATAEMAARRDFETRGSSSAVQMAATAAAAAM